MPSFYPAYFQTTVSFFKMHIRQSLIGPDYMLTSWNWPAFKKRLCRTLGLAYPATWVYSNVRRVFGW